MLHTNVRNFIASRALSILNSHHIYQMENLVSVSLCRYYDWLGSQVFSFEPLLQSVTLRISKILFLGLERR